MLHDAKERQERRPYRFYCTPMSMNESSRLIWSVSSALKGRKKTPILTMSFLL
ncbi:uncharacterized protein PHALS_09767 [Plasmopara halstedii]|uniref:Uncharacterized protein n=1 Tax=Plasmopara halstedii TaxID=4781 RepID=A0A0P1AF46_PLAHL|nr:uncharacterized protein PHALS_09767 [Plasmopara halstedii]CEG39525.1 hypothetical protein PHALS_09767 [Plasmopara halstedii]|eukprot:XP_024575894.1 hypothetical protein PHALS_09767 [Plasmopara halstedii]